MKQFSQRELNEARQFSMDGGQALHVHCLNQGHPLFERYPEIAHLFDQDKAQLIATARKLGVNVIKVEREGTPSQHIDLCGRPFDRAKAQCAKDTKEAAPAGQLGLEL